MENIPAGDSSIHQCYVFQTTPGIGYTVEVSNDLTSWTTQVKLYGIGHEYVVPLREFTPAPTSPPGSFPPSTPAVPTVNASLRMQPATGSPAGTVIAWASLDSNVPIIVRISGTLDAAWDLVPLYCQNFDTYSFFVWHPGYPITPPSTNPTLGPNDSALLAAIESNLTAMNAEVANSAASVRNAPLPAPPDPDDRRFWRVKVDADLDTDQDGSPDWAEFEIAARGTGMLIPGVIGDPYDADSNADGIPDGDQLDADLDGTADSKDPDAADNSVTIPLGPIPRYALFPFTLPSVEGDPGYRPIEINNKGTVLCPKHTWTAGKWTTLVDTLGENTNCRALGINDQGEIIGSCHRQPLDFFAVPPELYPGNMVYWTDSTAVPTLIQAGSEADADFAMDFEALESPLVQYQGGRLSNDGSFFAHSQYSTGYNVPTRFGKFLWTLPGPGRTPSRASIGDYSQLIDSDHYWGIVPDPQNSGTFLYQLQAGPDIITLPAKMNRMTKLADGSHFLGFNSGARGKILRNGVLLGNVASDSVIDMSSDGIAIGTPDVGIYAPLRFGNEWMPRERYAPELPASWIDSTAELLDTTPSGWILAQRGNYPEAKKEYALMLPIRVEGNYTRVAANPDDSHSHDTAAVGVDDFSVGSYSSGGSVGEKIWIMVPKSIAKRVVFKAPLNSKAPLEISAEGVNFPFFPSSTLNSSIAPFDIQADFMTPTGSEIMMDLKLGTEGSQTVSQSKPIGLKVMNERSIKLTIYKIARKRSVEGEPVPPDAALIPTKKQIEDYLLDIYKPQMNVKFEVTIISTDYPVFWDLNDDAKLDIGFDRHTDEQGEILTATKDDASSPNIKIFVISSAMALSNAANLAGATNRLDRTCWIWGSSVGDNDSKEDLMDTISHELGHVLVGYGHPNDLPSFITGEPALLGPAPLPETDHKKRRMCAGKQSNSDSRLFVKAEWDAAEIWMQTEEAAGRLGQ